MTVFFFNCTLGNTKQRRCEKAETLFYLHNPNSARLGWFTQFATKKQFSSPTQSGTLLLLRLLVFHVLLEELILRFCAVEALTSELDQKLPAKRNSEYAYTEQLSIANVNRTNIIGYWTFIAVESLVASRTTGPDVMKNALPVKPWLEQALAIFRQHLTTPAPDGKSRQSFERYSHTFLLEVFSYHVIFAKTDRAFGYNLALF